VSFLNYEKITKFNF